MPSQGSTPVTAITIVGGVYLERAVWPNWDQIFGSGGRAAAAISEHVDKIALHTYAQKDNTTSLQLAADIFKFGLTTAPALQSITFDYVHCLSTPVISPPIPLIKANTPIE